MYPNITNGVAEAPKGTSYGEVAIVVCDEGFDINGTRLIACRESGVWSSIPSCVPKGTDIYDTAGIFY